MKRKGSIPTVVWLLLAVGAALGQAVRSQPAAVPQWQIAAGGKMAFEVASVRASKPGTPDGSSVSLDAMEGPTTGNLFTANATFMEYLIFAYKISDANQVRAIFDKLPAWARGGHLFNVEARAEGSPTRDQLRLMVQALLADRFKLSMRQETQQHEEYIVVLNKAGKLGAQLQSHPIDKPCLVNPSTSQMIAAPAPGTDAPRYCGMVQWNIDGQRHLRMIDVTMGQIASTVSDLSDMVTPHSGVDGTGLTGRFDMDIQYLPEWVKNPDVSGPTFADALKSQLGLKLVERISPVEVLLIDHLEKPSEN